MANNNAENVSVGKPKASGAVFVAPKGTKLPTDASTALDSAFVNIGYISEDGVTNEIETDVEEIKAWGGNIVLTTQTSRSEKYGFTAIETNEQTLKLAFGDENVTVNDNGFAVVHNGADREEHVFAIETLMSGNRVKRQIIPRGKVAEVGEIVYKDDEAMGYEFGISAQIDENGNTAYEYIATLA